MKQICECVMSLMCGGKCRGGDRIQCGKVDLECIVDYGNVIVKMERKLPSVL